MAGQYTVLNSRGNPVATINPNATTGNNFPIELLGQAITPYKQVISATQYHLLENFADTVEPTNPVEGQFFYKIVTAGSNGQPHFYNGTKFLPLFGGGTSYSGSFVTEAVSIDFKSAGATTIFTAPNDGTTFHPTGLVLLPTDVTGVFSPPIPQFALGVGAVENVFQTTNLIGPDPDKSGFFSISGNRRFIKDAESLDLTVVTAGSATTMTYDAIIFGFNDAI